MSEIELSLLSAATQRSYIENLMRTFEQRSATQVNVSYKTWDTAWTEMMGGNRAEVPIAVSEVGTSWVPDLARTEGLKQVPGALAQKLGGEKAYIPELWRSCFLFGKPQMWAIPWVSGSRVIYYRRDLLDSLGINPDDAFATPDSMLNTVILLYEAGIAHPWITSNVSSLNTMHLVSTWLWAAGGDFISEDGERLLFAEPEAIDGMATFFQMGRYMGSPREYSYETAIDLFWRGDAAITMDGTWTYDAQKTTASQKVLDNLGVALAPGPAFIGGSNLVVMSNTRDKETAWNFLQFLSEPDPVLTMFRLTGLAPARLSLLNSHEVVSRAFGKVFNQAMKTGRSLPSHCFSGMVEDMLHDAFALVWTDVLKYPQKDVRDILAEHLFPLAMPSMA